MYKEVASEAADHRSDTIFQTLSYHIVVLHIWVSLSCDAVDILS